MRLASSHFTTHLASLCVSLGMANHVMAVIDEDIQVSLRVRSAGHELDGNNADSASILLRLSHRARWLDGLSTFVEFDHVETYLEDQFSDGVRLNGQPFVLDSEGTDLNQAFADIEHGDSLVRVGRQRLNFDDQRMVGGISIWQNEQTFDALQINHNIASGSVLSYTYAANVNRVFGDEAEEFLTPDDVLFEPLNGRRPLALLGDYNLNSHFLRLEYNEWDYSRLVSYGYFDDNQDRPEVTNRTIGLSYHFDFKVDALRYRLRIDGALQQRPEVDESSRIPYALLELAVRLNSLEFMSRTEMLGEDDNVAFVTPLASLHEFNGWADKFLLTPASGLVDQSLQMSWRNSPWRVSARYHVFSEYDGNSRYGDEIDLDLTYRLLDKHSLHLRYAYFREDQEFAAVFPDANKYFVTYAYNFN